MSRGGSKWRLRGLLQIRVKIQSFLWTLPTFTKRIFLSCFLICVCQALYNLREIYIQYICSCKLTEVIRNWPCMHASESVIPLTTYAVGAFSTFSYWLPACAPQSLHYQHSSAAQCSTDEDTGGHSPPPEGYTGGRTPPLEVYPGGRTPPLEVSEGEEEHSEQHAHYFGTQSCEYCDCNLTNDQIINYRIVKSWQNQEQVKTH